MFKYYTIFILSLVFIFTSCNSKPTIKGDGITKSADRKVGYISSIEVDGNFIIDISCGKSNSLKVEAEDNILPLIETKVDDEKLSIFTKEEITALKDIKINITLHTLKEIDSDGNSKITVKDLHTDELDVSANNEAVIELEGKVKELNITIDDEAKVLAKSVISKSAIVSIYGDGIAEVNARRYLDASVKGKGIINYWGDPEEISIKASGGGEVNKRWVFNNILWINLN